MKAILLDNKTRLLITKIIIALAFLSSLLLSWKLWISTRYYPLLPVADFLPEISYPLDYIVLIILLSLLAIILIPVSTIYKWSIRFLLFMLIILFFLDQSRLQPWAYMYFFVLATLSFISWPPKSKETSKKVINTLQLIIVCIYFWAGVQKLNPNFVNTMIPPFLSMLMPWFNPHPYTAGLFEIGIGLGLLFTKTRNLAVVFALFMWTMIFTTMGPFGQNFNNVVWPWIMAMASLTILLFYNSENISLKQILWVKNFVFQKIVLVLFGLMPLFSFFNLWDSYLSWSLYSGNFKHFSVHISQNIKYQLPPFVQNYVLGNSVNVLSWSLGELNVPHYPEDRTIKHVAKYLCSFAKKPDDVSIRLWQDMSLANYDYTLNCLDI